MKKLLHQSNCGGFKKLSWVLFVALLASMMVLSSVSVFASYQSGTNNGYWYFCWTNDKGTVNYQNQAGGRYTVSWNNNGASDFNFTCGKGWSNGSETRTVSYSGNFNPGNNGYLALYGWTKLPTGSTYQVAEYYVVESYGSWTPPGNGATSLGTLTSDGGTYNIYRTTRTNQPWVVDNGTGSFYQYWSVRSPKINPGNNLRGTITFKNHVDGWKRVGLVTGDFSAYYQVMETEGYGSTGNSDITVGTGSASGSWQAIGTGTNDDVFALCCNSNSLYVGGYFTVAGGTAVNRIAQYNISNNTWASLNASFDSSVQAIAYNTGTGTLYAAGTFTYPSNAFAKYKDGSWQGYETGMNGQVRALAYTSGKLYAGGSFSQAGTATGLNSLAVWNGTKWSNVGNFGKDGSGNNRLGVQVSALACDSAGVLYASWTYYEISGHGGTSFYKLSKYSNNTWTDILSPNGFFSALACSGTTLYAGGCLSFTSGSTTITSIGKYSNGTWSAMPGLESGAWVSAIAVSGNNVYAGGAFSTPVKNVAVWNGSSWSPLGSGLDSWVEALAVDASGRVYAGGSFDTPGYHIAVFK